MSSNIQAYLARYCGIGETCGGAGSTGPTGPASNDLSGVVSNAVLFNGPSGMTGSANFTFDNNNSIATVDNIALTDATTAPTAGAAGDFLRININGTFYKIQLYADT